MGYERMDFCSFSKLLLLVLAMLCCFGVVYVEGLACNWGTHSSHPLQPDIVARLLKENGFDKVKLFEADPMVMTALGKSGIQVMVGIPNDFLAALASSVEVADEWVRQNVSSYMSNKGVNIRHVAVGNEPFLKDYKDRYIKTTFPALKNVQAALTKAGLDKKIKVTIPLNADVYQTSSGLPSGGDFRSDIKANMISIIKFLNVHGSPLAINIYPFLSLYADPHFPADYAFFDGNSTPIVDGSISYTNVFDANFDTLISALEKNGFPSIPIIIGEVGWPSDGDRNANIQYARRFNQGLLNRIVQGRGTPKRRTPPDIYLFGLLDEDTKSIDPGNFERHWGLFYYDGTIKYQLDIGKNRRLVPAKGVKYLARRWCVMAPEASTSDPNISQSINYACSYADCTSLGYGSSCGGLDVRTNASYAFNMYYQTMNQQKGTCERFNKLATTTSIDPSPSRGKSCKFEIMIDLGRHEKAKNPDLSSATIIRKEKLVFVALLVFICSVFF